MSKYLIFSSPIKKRGQNFHFSSEWANSIERRDRNMHGAGVSIPWTTHASWQFIGFLRIMLKHLCTREKRNPLSQIFFSFRKVDIMLFHSFFLSFSLSLLSISLSLFSLPNQYAICNLIFAHRVPLIFSPKTFFGSIPEYNKNS